MTKSIKLKISISVILGGVIAHASHAQTENNKAPSGTSYIAESKTARYRHVTENGMAQPALSGESIVQEAWIETPIKSSPSGARNKIHIKIARPVETNYGLLTPVILIADSHNDLSLNFKEHNIKTDLDNNTYEENAPTINISEIKPRLVSYTWLQDYYIRRGFTVVSADSLGTAQSDGCPTVGTRDEAVAILSVIRWLTHAGYAKDISGKNIPANWSTGHIGMYGVSYDGALAEKVASLRPFGLEAIVPIAAPNSMYDYYRSSGLVRAPNGHQGEDVDVLMKAQASTNANPERCADAIDTALKDEDRTTGDYSDFWAKRETPSYSAAAALIAHGQTDDNVRTEQSVTWYTALKKIRTPVQLWLHQWGHRDPHELPELGKSWDDQVNRWFTRYLLGVGNSVENDSSVLIEQKDGSLLKESQWPPERARPMTYHLSEGDQAVQDKWDGLLDTYIGGAKIKKFTDDARISAITLANSMGRTDDDSISAATLGNSTGRTHRVRYETLPFQVDARLTGTPTARLRMAFSRISNVTALLVDRSPSGQVSIVTRAWADPRNRNSLSKTESIQPGMFYDINLTFMPKDYVFKKYHNLGLVVLSSDSDATLLPKPGSELSIDGSGELNVLLIKDEDPLGTAHF